MQDTTYGQRVAANWRALIDFMNALTAASPVDTDEVEDDALLLGGEMVP